MDRSEAKRQYKESPPAAGVYTVVGRASGLRLVASSRDVDAALNRHRFALRVGSHRNRRLQRDYDEGGADGLSFEVLDRVDRDDPNVRDLDAELVTLEALWTERLGLGREGDYRSFGPVI
jgi:hypothetical protein